MNQDSVALIDRLKDQSSLPFIISEAGVNHNGSLDQALELVKVSHEIGADAVKFQSFKADKLSKNETPKVPYQLKDEPHQGESHHQMLKRLEMDDESMKEIKSYCDSLGIVFLSTPYDPESVGVLKGMGVSAIKVASADCVDYSIHSEIRKNALPVIQGLGMCEFDEIRNLVSFYQEQDPEYPMILLQCTSNYPANPLNSNINFLNTLKYNFPEVFIGFSDHTVGSESAILALALGARVFEKHFTLDKNQAGPDHAASCDPGEFTQYIKDIKRSYEILGDGQKNIAEEEKDMRRISRKGAYLLRDIKEGEMITIDDIQVIRPAMEVNIGQIWPKLGKKATRAISKGEQLSPGDFR